MTNMHPHWQSTDGDEQAVRITSVQKNKLHAHERDVHASPVRASRRPAAIAGIAMILIAGFFGMGGIGSIQSLLGQASTSVTVQITSNGTDPETVTVSPGETITWTNNDTIPHILSSDTLPTSDGQPFMTSAIFPGASTHFLVPPTAPAGMYAYISKTAQNISGHIVIQGSAMAQTSVASVSMQQASSAAFIPPVTAVSSVPDMMQNTSVPALTSSEQAQLGGTTTPVPANVIPENPHTVSTASSLPTRQQPGTQKPAVTAHTPTGEPATGPDVYVVIGMSMAAVLWISRKALGSVAL